MAYAAVISLRDTINSLVAMDPSCYLLFSDSTPEIIEHVNEEVDLLQKSLQELDGSIGNNRTERLNALDGEIRESICDLEDKLESLVLNQYSSTRNKNNIGRSTFFFMDLQELKQDMDYFTQRVGNLKAEYTHEFQYPSREEEDEDDDHHLGANEYSEMVGLSDMYNQIRERLMKGSSMVLVTLYGMTGLGKTTLANKLLHDPLCLTRFDIHVLVTIGPAYKLEDVLLDILKQVDPDHQELLVEGEEKIDGLKTMIHKGLEGRRYFVVLDDLWDKNVWYRHLANLFTWRGDGSHVLVTTTIEEVADIADWSFKHGMRFMSKQESWYLLREKVFGKEWISNSYQLEKAGKKIAKNCEGLPLTIVTVGNILSKSSEKMSITYLNEVAANKQHQVFIEAYDQMFKVLYPNYNYLPQHLKPCFLYMAIFPQNHDNPLTHLFNLWYSEGFVEHGRLGHQIFDELCSRSLVMSTYTLHPAFWHMCKKVAAREKFFHTLNRIDDVLAEDVMESQRRLCVHNNVLFGIKYAYDSMASVYNVRSLLCTGPYHQYPVQICMESWRLLRILHAISIRFYEFPMQVLKLIQLRYLALTYDGDLPHSISKHWNLRRLIIRRHMNIVDSDGRSSYMPTEIWDMQGLSHLRVMGSNLPHPPRETSRLPYLSVLRDVSAQSCTKDIFERISNLQKLGIQIELAPDAVDDDEPMRVFDHISQLSQLRALECVIANPVLKRGCNAFASLSVFPSSLRELTLSGLGFPWEEMSKISSLPNVTHLKLQCYAFRGPRWEVRENGFPQLKVLTIEDADLVHWMVEDCHCFEKLAILSIKDCYKLEEIPMEFGKDIDTVELIDCNPLALSCVKQLKVNFDRKYCGRRHPLDLTIESSWDI